MADWKNNGRLKLLIIVGTRPEIIRLAAVIKKCRKYFDTLLAHTGQNYDYNLNGVFFRDLGLADPDVYLEAVGKDLGETMGNIIAKSYELMVSLQPDAVLVLGDTNSCLSVIGAKRLHIPIFHMEAGNRCKDECLPEETNRRIVDIISDVNLAYSEHARRYLADCGLPKERTYVNGSPMAEVLTENDVRNLDAVPSGRVGKGIVQRLLVDLRYADVVALVPVQVHLDHARVGVLGHELPAQGVQLLLDVLREFQGVVAGSVQRHRLRPHLLDVRAGFRFVFQNVDFRLGLVHQYRQEAPVALRRRLPSDM